MLAWTHLNWETAALIRSATILILLTKIAKNFISLVAMEIATTLKAAKNAPEHASKKPILSQV